MFLDISRKRRIFLGVVALILCVVFTVGVLFYKDDFVDSRRRTKVASPTLNSRHRKVLLPARIEFPESILEDHLKGTSSENWETFQLDDGEVMEKPPLEPGRFSTTKSFLYGLSKTKECENKKELKFGIDESMILPLNLKKLFKIFKEEMKTYGDTYNEHLLPMFDEYLNAKKSKEHWFRFSGSSVWLKDYSIHFVVSRLVFSEVAERNNPRISLLLAQVFDEQWQEIQDVRLVFPTNHVEGSPGFQVDGQDFRLDRFPRILPAPFALGESDLYWGAEDPRMTLVRNKKGYEEPLVVFNSCRGQEVLEPGEDDEEEVVVDLNRSMFMSFPFQIQRGKRIPLLSHDSTTEHFFLRTNPVMIEGVPESDIEKNWSPFCSSAGEYDEHVFFATHLSPLRVIKCELWTDDKKCSLEGDEDGKVGSLRGGTPLISLKRIENEDKEFFFGLARTHLRDCGCGLHFYRPNLVVVARKGSKWSLSHVSASVDLGMDILPWLDDGKVCTDINAMIPNGIQYLDREKDLLSVDLSVSDFTVEHVTIKGLLQALENTKYWKDEVGKKRSPVKCAIKASAEFCKVYGSRNLKKRWLSPAFESFSLDHR